MPLWRTTRPSIELLCFAKTLEKYGRLLKEGSAVLIRGKLSVRDEKPPQILCDGVLSLTGQGGSLEPAGQSARPAVQVLDGKVLWIRLPSIGHPAFGHINRVINMFPGQTPVKLVFTDTGKRMGTTCLLGKSLVDELVAVLGQENVTCSDRNQ